MSCHCPVRQYRQRGFEVLKFVKRFQALKMMFLYYYVGPDGRRVYTLQKFSPDGKPTIPAHPARFTPADTYSKYRIIVKKRHGLLLTQQKEFEF